MKKEIRVSLLIDIRFLFRPSMTKTFNNLRGEVGVMLPVWEIGRETPLPTTQFLLDYESALSN